MLAARRLPGIQVDVAPPPVVEALPRMDVAVFVGFAATGPLHVPVVLESAAEFAGVFGSDAPLAWDDARGERVYAYLGPAVRAFFSNGGRRCWVIRVARVETARANGFEVPGVLSVGPGATLQRARAQARCEGSWSDDLRLSTALTKRSFGIDAFWPGASPTSDRFVFRTRMALRPGDLIEIGDPERSVAYAVVDRVDVSVELGGSDDVKVTLQAAFERLEKNAADILVPASVQRGQWTSWEDAGHTLWLRIDEIEYQPTGTASPIDANPSLTAARVSGATWRELGTMLPSPLFAVRRAQLLSLDLDVTGEQAVRLSGVGLTPRHPQAWWNQVSDVQFYRQPEYNGLSRTDEARRNAMVRFPLCGADEPDLLAWIPLGVGPLFGAKLGRLPEPGSPLERDGLARFDADLFLDPELGQTPISTLLEFADAIRYRRSQTRALRGLHAALSIGGGGPFSEASLLAIPDAVHVGWSLRDEDHFIAPRSDDEEVPPHWRTHRGECPSSDATPLEGPDFGVFLDCATRLLARPQLSGPHAPVPPGAYQLTWTESEPGAEYRLIEATQADLSLAREVYRGANREHTALNQREGVYYYQVFAHAGEERSAGSAPIAVRVRADDYRQTRAQELDAGVEEQWLSVHRAGLRMAAATGELFVAFAMPRHFRTPETLRYAERLRGAMGVQEASALSYGALYFPWLQSDVRTSDESRAYGEVVRAAARQPRVVPPDGPAVGVLAARASNRGAWIAAANEPMLDVVALSPVIDASDWQRLQDAQVNLVRADPRGFLALSADTLSLDVDLRPINVRRLLTLLRRLALRRGASYVFEPNGPALRRAVERGFGLLLDDLFRRGAFAGATAEKSFRVVTDDTINTPRDAEAGRFVVELRVAPSVPMRFVTVRLAQSGPRLTVTEEL